MRRFLLIPFGEALLIPHVIAPFSIGGLSNVRRKAQAFGWAISCSFASGIFVTAFALWKWGAVEVRGHLGPVLFLTFVAAAWLLLTALLFPWLGLAISDDVIERRNPGALVALCGALLGVALIYAGGNLGEGPSNWENIFSAGLGTVGFFGSWFLLEWTGHFSRAIAEERDLASGVRICGFFLALGLILGRSVAGDWHSTSATFRDFVTDGWPAGAIVVLAAIIESLLRPSRGRRSSSFWPHGVAPAVVYVALAMAWFLYLGWWEGKP